VGGVEFVGLLGGVVRTIALDPGESQDHSRDITRTWLKVVARHLNHELGGTAELGGAVSIFLINLL
jgi:hypothetical protein